MKGRIEVDRIEHQNVFHLDPVWRGNIVDPLEKKLRRRFLYSKYPEHWCSECGRLMKFDIEKKHTYIAAVFVCEECDEGPEPVINKNWGFMI